MASAVSARPRLRSWPDTLASRLNCSSNGTIERLDPDASTEVLGVKSAANPAPRHARPAANNSVGRASRDVSAGGAITVGQALTATDPVSGSNRAPQPKPSTGHGPPHRLAPRDRARTAGDQRRHGPTACTIPRHDAGILAEAPGALRVACGAANKAQGHRAHRTTAIRRHDCLAW